MRRQPPRPKPRCGSTSWRSAPKSSIEEESARLRQGTTAQASVKEELKKVRDEQKKSSMDTAREKAKEMLELRRGKRQVSFKPKAAQSQGA